MFNRVIQVKGHLMRRTVMVCIASFSARSTGFIHIAAKLQFIQFVIVTGMVAAMSEENWLCGES